ncbi:histidine phosphatase family protein [uncultured Shimia sp.]|uniref:SixA phosphatase family protein n=1 Tax=uncultured Shimia sp. TaxID=573152 RepID=UPI00261A5E60|nr:histidine phosphatase family protein [uncultured Shimia sp.]
MALKLILTRHAKSSWKQLDLTDHARPLNKRGRASAEAVGDWLRHEKMVPDETLSSDAARTRETAALMGFDVEPVFLSALYHAGSTMMLRQLHNATGKKVMMIGHNPGIAEFAERLARDLPAHRRFLDYPTCATTVFKFDVDSWADVSFGTGKVKKFIVPRELVAA